ncbi:MAG: phosphoribosylaminoimidazolesuccinocarboxamide synthase [Leptospira sp.]|nr:phosphoribosylaminoimidazolesuccinocarboxamide synthase [Leptospira sp.]
MKLMPDYTGKVRDVYDLGDKLILCSSDRVSAFDVVFSECIPGKGKILNSVSALWFEYFHGIKNHLIETDARKFPPPFCDDDYFPGRSVLVKKCKRIDYECVVRGYLSGSAFKEYKKTGQIAFADIRTGYRESEKLDEPLFTPATKNDIGHDENVSEKTMKDNLGDSVFSFLKETSLKIYSEAASKLSEKGVILCDTKFEFGFLGDEILLIDELLTPDSSRYWDKETYSVGISPPSYDKQILRDYLEKTGWDKNPPPPNLPQDLINELSLKYNKLEGIVRSCLSEK